MDCECEDNYPLAKSICGKCGLCDSWYYCGNCGLEVYMTERDYCTCPLDPAPAGGEAL